MAFDKKQNLVLKSHGNTAVLSNSISMQPITKFIGLKNDITSIDINMHYVLSAS